MSTNSTAAEFYAYGTPNGSSANTGLELSETLLVMLHEDTNTGNTSLIIILDQANNGVSGDVDMTVNCLPDSAAVAFSDDGGELFGGPPTIIGDFIWAGCCTDGGIISGVGCGNTITINPTINSGVNFFSLVYGTPATPTYINMPDIQCPITINCGGVSCCDDAFDFSATTQNLSCEDSNDGSIDLTTDCATTPTFQWSNGAITEDLSGLPLGTYTVTITDANACSEVESYTLTANATSPQPTITGALEYCEGEVVTLGVDAVYSAYLWSTGSTNATLPANAPGNYSVTVTNSFGCTGTDAVSVAEHPSPESTIIRTLCEGEGIEIGGILYDVTGQWDIVFQTNFGCDSTIYLDVTILNPDAFVYEPPAITCIAEEVVVDGTLSSGDVYQWTTIDGCISGGNTFPFINACSAGTYCLTVSSFGVDQGVAVECTEEFCVDVIEDNNGADLEVSGTDLNCESDNDGSATVTVTGGAPAPYIYTWNTAPPQIGETITNLSAGTYCTTVTSIGNGCTSEACVTLLAPSAIEIDIVGDDILCNGEDSGIATAIVGGGAGGYEFEWNPGGETTSTISGLSAGVYTVIVTDANGCTDENSVTINEPDAFDTNLSSTDALCNGGNSGTASIAVSGGVGTLDFEWNTTPPQNSPTAVDLPAGEYTVTVTDENNCSLEESIIVGEPAPMSLTTENTETSCNNTPDGSATVNASGGAMPFQYFWDDPAEQTTATADNLTSGDYTVTVTDGNGCTAEVTVTVSSPNGMDVMPDFTNVSCNGGGDGAATASTTGGTMPYTFIWEGLPNEDSETVTGLLAGTYNLTIEDANGCEEYETFVITAPDAIVLNTTTENAFCNGDANGTASVSAMGGTGGFDFEWNTIPIQNGETATGLSVGNYTVLATDANGCTATGNVVINEPTALSLSTNSTAALCYQQADGTATVTPDGGTSPYTYLWSDDLNQITPTATNLLVGNYTVTVTDDHGCTEEISLEIDEPEALIIDWESTNPDCGSSQNGTATVTPEGGTPPYFYQWDANANDQITPTATGLDGGTFIVTITDDNGCTEMQSIDLVAPPAILLTVEAENVLCFGENTGTATVNPSGGTPPFTFQWNDNANQNTVTAVNLEAGNYTVTVTDNNDCTEETTVDLTQPAAMLDATGTSTDALCGVNNGSIDLTVTGGTSPYTFDWNNGQITIEDPQGLNPGTYSVVVTDASDCTFATSVQVSTPTGLEALVAITNTSCNGLTDGLIDITVNGGIAPYDFDWDVDINDGNEDFENVGAGNYILIVTDADGCTVTANALVEEPDALEATATPSQASCGGSDGSISLVISGGSGDYVFDWDNDGTGDNDDPQSPDGLPQGDYIGVATDENGCSITVNATVEVPDGPEVIDVSAVDLACFEDNSGSIILDITGGEQPYIFEWNDPDFNDQENNLNNLYAGLWEVVVTDDNDCTTTASVTLSEPPPFEATNLIATGVACNGDNSGSIVLDVSGGTLPYDFLWDNTSQTVSDPDNLSAGTYTVTATDAQGCTDTETVEIDEPDEIIMTTTAVATACNGTSDGSINLTVTGGIPDYTFSWNGGAFLEEDLLNIPAGQYTVIVTDANGCTQSTTTLVDQPQALDLIIDNVSNYGNYNVSCSDASDGAAEAIANGGTAPFSYQWDNGTNGAQIDEIAEGTYVVTVTDAEGCTNSTQIILEAPQAMTGFVQANDADCFGENDGQVIVESVSGGTAPYLYSLGSAFGSGSQFLNLSDGTYEVVVQDANGCEWATSVTLTEPAEFIVNLGEDQEILLGDSVQLVPILNSSAIDTFVWKEREIVDFEPWVSPALTQSYSIVVTNENGCKAEDMILVRVKKERLVYIPNTFSPNADGTNDMFYIYAGRGVASISDFQIFSRWGEQVFELPSVDLDNNFNPLKNGWDGTFNGEPLDPGVFVYKVEVQFIDGSIEIYKGDVTLTK